MPEFVPPERAAFAIAADGMPVISLGVNQAGVDAVDASAAPPLAGWRLMPRLTLTVVDGPGDAGYLVSGVPARLADAERWIQAVESRSGAVVLYVGGAHTPHHLPTAGLWPGGFVGLTR